MRWLAVRLDIVSIALITTTGLIIVLMHGQIPPAYAGLAISYAVQVSASFVSKYILSFGTYLMACSSAVVQQEQKVMGAAENINFLVCNILKSNSLLHAFLS